MSLSQLVRAWFLKPLYVEKDGSPGILTRIEGKVERCCPPPEPEGAVKLEIIVGPVSQQEG